MVPARRHAVQRDAVRGRGRSRRGDQLVADRVAKGPGAGAVRGVELGEKSDEQQQRGRERGRRGGAAFGETREDGTTAIAAEIGGRVQSENQSESRGDSGRGRRRQSGPRVRLARAARRRAGRKRR